MSRPEIDVKEKNNRQYTPNRIFYAGQSQRRSAFLKHCFPGIHVEAFDIDPEPEIPDVVKIMRYKIGRLVNGREIQLSQGDAIFAADTRTITKAFDDDDKGIITISRGKPKTLREVRNNLFQMLLASEEGCDPPFYLVESASGASYLTGDSSPIILGGHTVCQIVLNNLGLSYLITNGGFKEYLEKFYKFYSSSPYSAENMNSISPLALSGGISLPVLVRMGLVDSINGVSRDSGLFKTMLKQAVHIAAVGMDPNLMRLFGVDENKMMDEWNWLNKVVSSSLGER